MQQLPGEPYSTHLKYTLQATALELRAHARLRGLPEAQRKAALDHAGKLEEFLRQIVESESNSVSQIEIPRHSTGGKLA